MLGTSSAGVGSERGERASAPTDEALPPCCSDRPNPSRGAVVSSGGASVSVRQAHLARTSCTESEADMLDDASEDLLDTTGVSVSRRHA